MKKILILMPYFGRFPESFPLWLLSVRHNPTIDWLIFTDAETRYDWPANVRIVHETWAWIKEKIQSNFSFKIKLETPWGLHAFKPCYGEVFSDYLDGYDFWGYCDCDVIFGDIRGFITENILKTHDKILWLGHLSLIRNTTMMKKGYKLATRNGDVLYRRAFEEAIGPCFDEVGFNDIVENNGFSVFREMIFADFFHRSFLFKFIAVPLQCKDGENEHRIFLWENGRLFCHELNNSKVVVSEYLYIHFCRRPMRMGIDSENPQALHRFLMVPGKFLVHDGDIDAKTIAKYTRNRPYWEYYLPRLRPDRLLKKILTVWTR
jgi:hypothetical protein